MVEISDFEEREYNLSSIGLYGYSLCIEETVKYIYGPNFYIEINNDIIVEKKDNDYIIKNDGVFLFIPSDTYDILKQLIFD